MTNETKQEGQEINGEFIKLIREAKTTALRDVDLNKVQLIGINDAILPSHRHTIVDVILRYDWDIIDSEGIRNDMYTPKGEVKERYCLQPTQARRLLYFPTVIGGCDFSMSQQIGCLPIYSSKQGYFIEGKLMQANHFFGRKRFSNKFATIRNFDPDEIRGWGEYCHLPPRGMSRDIRLPLDEKIIAISNLPANLLNLLMRKENGE